MPFIPLESLLRPTTTPEQEIFLTGFFEKFNNASSANKKIVNVEPLYYEGDIAAAEFLVYAATKLYLCYDLLITASNPANLASPGTVRYTNEIDSVIFDTTNLACLYTGAIAGYNTNMIQIINIYFARLVSLVNYDKMRFIGYRITLQ